MTSDALNLTPHGSRRLFLPCPAGSRELRILLARLGADNASEQRVRFAVKKHRSEKTVTADGWRHDQIQLLPLKPAIKPITPEPEDASDLTIVGEYLGVAGIR